MEKNVQLVDFSIRLETLQVGAPSRGINKPPAEPVVMIAKWDSEAAADWMCAAGHTLPILLSKWQISEPLPPNSHIHNGIEDESL